MSDLSQSGGPPMTTVGAFVCTPPPRDDHDKPGGWTSDKWATPWPTLSHLEDRFGAFDLDPCCEPHTAKAATFYIAEDNGLSKPWFGNVFVNPPYSQPRPWCERALRATSTSEARQVVMLLPCATDTAWFHETVWPHAELYFIRGRVRFLGWRGTPLPSPRTPSLVAVFRAKAVASDYDRLYAAARKVVDAANKGYVYAELPAILDLEAALDGEI